MSSEDKWSTSTTGTSVKTQEPSSESPGPVSSSAKRPKLATEGSMSREESTENRLDSTPVRSSPTDVAAIALNEVENEDLDEPFDEAFDVERDDDDADDDDDEEEDVESTMLGDDDAESVVTRLISPALEQEREARKVEDRKLLALLAHFDEEQLNRFETFRRATFAKASVRRLIQSISPGPVSQNVVIAMAGMTKVFVGELVEEALDYKERLGETGPLQPKHIREAYRVLSETQESSMTAMENPLR